MATYRLMARISLTGPREHQVVVSAIPDDLGSVEVRRDTVPTLAEAELRRDYLLMSLATELSARGHTIAGAEL
jgi:hypothetical protein